MVMLSLMQLKIKNNFFHVSAFAFLKQKNTLNNH